MTNPKISSVLANFEATISKNNEVGGSSNMYLTNVVQKQGKEQGPSVTKGRPPTIMMRSNSNRKCLSFPEKKRSTGAGASVETETTATTWTAADDVFQVVGTSSRTLLSIHNSSSHDDSSFSAECFDFDEVDWDDNQVVESKDSEPNKAKSTRSSEHKSGTRHDVARRTFNRTGEKEEVGIQGSNHHSTGTSRRRKSISASSKNDDAISDDVGSNPSSRRSTLAKNISSRSVSTSSRDCPSSPTKRALTRRTSISRRPPARPLDGLDDNTAIPDDHCADRVINPSNPCATVSRSRVDRNPRTRRNSTTSRRSSVGGAERRGSLGPNADRD